MRRASQATCWDTCPRFGKNQPLRRIICENPTAADCGPAIAPAAGERLRFDRTTQARRRYGEKNPIDTARTPFGF
jgi:hypothetical protein